jgi:predicted NUDIX family NTP pyrophosphohydrolase
MKKKLTAGILLYRLTPDEIEVFLVHPGRAAWRPLSANSKRSQASPLKAPSSP